MIHSEKVKKRFWDKVEFIPFHSCYEWVGCKSSDGYGNFSVRDKMVGAHRISWEIHFGDIPKNMSICHACDNPACVRPEHLFIGTHEDNMRDMIAKGRHRPLYGTKNHLSKLCKTKVHKIRKLYASGKYNQYEIAAMFDVSRPTIGSIIKGKTWRQV